MTVVAVVGGKKTGKTTVTENLTRELTRRGYRVAAVKHISEPDFTIDTEGKDTWRFAQAGSRTIIGISSGEIATIEKVNTENLPFEDLLKKCRDSDVVILEGFRKLTAKSREVVKIAVLKSAEDATEAEKNFSPLLAFAGLSSLVVTKSTVPYVNVLKNAERLADLVEKTIREKNS
jgi:molybdopterin-guanine dinucleotide biosynthesis protein B